MHFEAFKDLLSQMLLQEKQSLQLCEIVPMWISLFVRFYGDHNYFLAVMAS